MQHAVRRALTLLLSVSTAVGSVNAQPPAGSNPELNPDSTRQVMEASPRVRPLQPVSIPPVDESKWPSPTLTMFKSMLVPGWGQMTNQRYIKAAAAIGLETWFLAGALYNWKKANEALDRFRADPNNLNDFSDYQFYWGNRSDFMWLLGLTVFVSMFDAYVDAHLRPYQEDTIPGVEPPKGVRLIISF